MRETIIFIGIALIVVGGYALLGGKEEARINTRVKIGVITDLTGPAAYWGESTRAGATILEKELAADGLEAEFIFEDYGLDAPKAASAAQKLVNIDKVDAVYAEFNPGAIATASFLKDKQIPFIYDAAVASPLKDNPLFYKTYLDYQEGCKQIAQKFKNGGVAKIGMLKVNLEFGELCQAGIKEVYGADMIAEGYNLGDTDFRTQLLKIAGSGAGAVINVGFEGDTANTLKIIRDFKYSLRYGTVDDTITESVLATYGAELKGGWTFGFNEPTEDFLKKLEEYNVGLPYGAALAYTHLKQLAETVSKCGDDVTCINKELDGSPKDETIGFHGYNDRVAELTMKIKQY